MIIKITQTASNIKQRFDVELEGEYCQGEAGSFSELQDVTLTGKNGVLKAVFAPLELKKCFPNGKPPFKAVFTNPYIVYKDEKTLGSMVRAVRGIYKESYLLTTENSDFIHCYCRAKGAFNFVSIYAGDKQIALMETYLATRDCKYCHKLYLLDEYAHLSELLSLFAVCYSSTEFSKRFHMSMGTAAEKEWSFSRYNSKYDHKWREIHFPKENYFGRILEK